MRAVKRAVRTLEPSVNILCIAGRVVTGLLLGAGCDPTAQNIDGDTALDLTKQFDDSGSDARRSSRSSRSSRSVRRRCFLDL